MDVQTTIDGSLSTKTIKRYLSSDQFQFWLGGGLGFDQDVHIEQL